jgi:hypothetical protein
MYYVIVVWRHLNCEDLSVVFFRRVDDTTPEAEGTTIHRNAGNYIPVDTAQPRRKLESLVGCL